MHTRKFEKQLQMELIFLVKERLVMPTTTLLLPLRKSHIDGKHDCPFQFSFVEVKIYRVQCMEQGNINLICFKEA